MSKENKGREFWICAETSQQEQTTFSRATGKKLESVHVIEYSAFEKCQAENEELKQTIKVLKGAMEQAAFGESARMIAKLRYEKGMFESREKVLNNQAQHLMETSNLRLAKIEALEQRLADKEQDLREYKHEWESACERVRNREDDISRLNVELETAIEKVNSCNARELRHISLIDSQADMIEEFKQRLAEAESILLETIKDVIRNSSDVMAKKECSKALKAWEGNYCE